MQYLIGNGLMKLEKPMKLTEYVKTIFLPSSVPLGTNCQIHGTHNEEFNYVITLDIAKDESVEKCCTSTDTVNDYRYVL